MRLHFARDYLELLVRQPWNTVSDVDGLTDVEFLSPARPELTRRAELVRDVIRTAAHAIDSCNAPATDQIAMLLHLHALHIANGLPAAIEASTVEPCVPIVRSMLESVLGLEYLLESDTDNRSLAYRVGTVHRRLSYLRLMDASSQEGKKFQAKVLVDKFVGKFRIPDQTKVHAAIAENEAALTTQELRGTEQEWQRVKTLRKRPPAWYSLYGGPANLEELATRVGAGAIYDILYRKWSQGVHAEEISGGVKDAGGKLHFKHLHDPSGIEDLMSFAISLLIHSTKTLVQHYGGKAGVVKFEYSYFAHLRERHLQIAGKRVFKVT